MSALQRLCPHPLGWSYNTYRRRRWCRVCAQQQRRVDLSPSDVEELRRIDRSNGLLAMQQRVLTILSKAHPWENV